MAEMTLSMHDNHQQISMVTDFPIITEDEDQYNTFSNTPTTSPDRFPLSRSPLLCDNLSIDDELDCKRSAKLFYQAISHRMAANSAAYAQTVVLWKGTLPFHRYSFNSRLSTKIFIGGLPWECTHSQLTTLFSVFGNCSIEIPSTNNANIRNCHLHQPNSRRHSIHQHYQNQRFSHAFNNSNDYQTFPGFAYIVFECEKSVHNVLHNCCRDDNDKFFYALPCCQGRRSSSFLKKIQIIPWDEQDTYYVDENSAQINPKIINRIDDFPANQRYISRRATVPSVEVKRTVFVGALHGMITASGLAKIMSEMFGPVDSVMLDTDKHRYPIGSGRVTFVHHCSYQQAIRTQFVRVKTSAFDKTIQIDPYLYDEPCFICSSFGFGSPSSSQTNNVSFNGPLAFCRSCMVYFCSTCWYNFHYNPSAETIPSPFNIRRSNSLNCSQRLMTSNIDIYQQSDITEHIPLIRSSRYALQPSYQQITRRSFP
ncbi:hypothetical protein GJ496_000200 [Pomphorhynchus laevis]|nr:hypothetical protein GJ496_000200 [Pomphorhynchus laevis]